MDHVSSSHSLVWYSCAVAVVLALTAGASNGDMLAMAPEIGENDFRISYMGPDGDVEYSARNAAVAYNSTNDEFLVVWEGDHHHNDDVEIYAQRIDAATGAAIGGNFRISDMGTDGDTAYQARDCAVAYNSTNNEYLVVWAGEDDTAPLVDEDYEIFGQRIDAATGAEIGANDFRISHLGTDGDPASGRAGYPAVAYNSADNEYLVVWVGFDNTPPLVLEEIEIFGQRVGAAGELVGDASFRISDAGPDGDTAFLATSPDVAYNSTANEYLVVWMANETVPSGPSNPQVYDIYGQRIAGSTGAELGTNDFRISDMGPEGDADVLYQGVSPAVAYDPNNNRYLVVWWGDDDQGTLVDGENEVFGQLLDGTTGEEIGADDFRISDMGPDGDTSYTGVGPRVAFSTTTGEYLVVWSGDDAVDGEFEVYAQQLNADGEQVDVNDYRISNMGPDGDTDYIGSGAAVAFASASNLMLIVWHGELTPNEFEIFGQLFTTVARTTTTITANDPDPSVFGQTVTFSYQVSAETDLPTGDVTVSDGQESCTATVAEGECELVFTSTGEKTVTATYSGDVMCLPSTSAAIIHTVNRAPATATITTASPDPSVVGQPVRVSYAVSSVFGSPTGNVTVSDGAHQCTGTVAAGECTISFTTAGERDLNATYAGDTNFADAATSEAFAHAVNKGDTAITLAPAADSAADDDYVTFIATVAAVAPAGGIPTGALTFTVDDTTAGTVDLDPSGRAMLATWDLTPDGCTIGATYAGDTNYNASNTAYYHELSEGLPPACGCGAWCGSGAGLPLAVSVLGLVRIRRRFQKKVSG